MLGDADPACGYLIHSPTAWEEVAIIMAMQGDVQHAGVLVESLLCAIAMVNILHNTVGRGLGKVQKQKDGGKDTLEGFQGR